MIGQITNNPEISYVRERIVRVHSHLGNRTSGGTGFFISDKGLIITCWHVLVGNLLREIREKSEFQEIEAGTEAEKIKSYTEKAVQKVEVVLSDGSKKKVIIKGYDYKYDLAILKTMKSSGKKPFFELDLQTRLDYLDDTVFCGFPESPGYKMQAAPFALNTGVVAAFPELSVGGEHYTHIQLNGINLGGNSGAPLLRRGENKVYGIINGNFIKYIKNLAVFKDENNIDAGITKGSFVVPLGITYSTPLVLLNRKSEIFKKVVKRL